MGIFDRFKNSISENQQSFHELKQRIIHERLSDEDFRRFSELSYHRKRAKDEEFRQGKHDIFSDNVLFGNEIDFFKSFVKNTEHAGFNSHLLRLNRMSDKTLNVCYMNYQIGRIKLQGRKTRIQILEMNDVNWIENQSLDSYTELSKQWIIYLKDIV